MNYSWITSSDRQAYHELLLLGDEDEGMLARYASTGDLLVAFDDTQPVGVALFVPVSKNMIELKNLAVAPTYQRRGIGAHLTQLGLKRYTGHYQEMLVGTGDRDRDNIQFYEHQGFVQSGIRENFFKQYAQPILVNGAPLKDMLLFIQAVPAR